MNKIKNRDVAALYQALTSKDVGEVKKSPESRKFLYAIQRNIPRVKEVVTAVDDLLREFAADQSRIMRESESDGIMREKLAELSREYSGALDAHAATMEDEVEDLDLHMVDYEAVPDGISFGSVIALGPMIREPKDAQEGNNDPKEHVET